MATVEELMRESAARWVRGASIEDLAMYLPRGVWTTPVHTTTPKSGRTGVVVGPLESAPSAVEHALTREESGVIRDRMRGQKPGTPEYDDVRDELCKELNLTARQVGAVIARQNRTKNASASTGTPATS